MLILIYVIYLNIYVNLIKTPKMAGANLQQGMEVPSHELYLVEKVRWKNKMETVFVWKYL